MNAVMHREADRSRIKILHVITRPNAGGVSDHVFPTIEGLRTMGYDVALIAGRCEAAEVEVEANVRGSYLRIKEMSRSVRPLKNLRALVKLWQYMRQVRPDVVHTHTAMAGCLGRIAAFCAGVRIIVHTFHGNSLRGYFSPLTNALFVQIERCLARMSNAICVVSPQQINELCERFRIAPRSSFRVVPYGLDLAPFKAIEPGSFEARPLRIGWLGRFVPVKNIPLLLEIIEATLQETDQVEFHIAGDGPERHAVVEAARRHCGRLVWHGWIHNIGDFLANCHLLIQTSINEGTPFTLIQGMAAGRPFLSTPAGGVVDMVSGSARMTPDGCAWHENGVLIPPHPGPFVDALTTFLQDRSLGKRMGQQAREFALTQYDERNTLIKIDRLYRELLETNRVCEVAFEKLTGGTT